MRRCRADEAIAILDAAVAERGISAGTLRSAPTPGRRSPAWFRARLAEHGVTHRRGGHRDPESQAFIESWFGKLKQRCVWREEFETIDQAREAIGAYITTYDRRPHSGLNYKTTAQVAGTRKDHQDQAIPAA